MDSHSGICQNKNDRGGVLCSLVPTRPIEISSPPFYSHNPPTRDNLVRFDASFLTGLLLPTEVNPDTSYSVGVYSHKNNSDGKESKK